MPNAANVKNRKEIEEIAEIHNLPAPIKQKLPALKRLIANRMHQETNFAQVEGELNKDICLATAFERVSEVVMAKFSDDIPKPIITRMLINAYTISRQSAENNKGASHVGVDKENNAPGQFGF